MVVKGYSQEEGIDFDDTCAPVPILGTITIFLAYVVQDILDGCQECFS